MRTRPNRRWRRSVSAAGGALVEQADGIEQSIHLGGGSPGRMALGFAFGLDVAAELDEGDQAVKPRLVLLGGRAGSLADAVAEFPGELGPADLGVRSSRARASNSSVLSASDRAWVDARRPAKRSARSNNCVSGAGRG